MDALRLERLTARSIGCAFKVSNSLGAGFLEKVYENSLAYELRKAGLNAEQQFPIEVKYDGRIVGEYFADLLVESSLLIELKAVEELNTIHAAQCVNYLKASGLRLCLLINFGRTRLGIRRFANRF